MTGTRQILPPTSTLARLYEDQQQYMDALAAYELIYKSNPDPQIEEAIDRLLKKILIESNVQYIPIVDQIFTPDEKLKFRIAPAEVCEAYEKARSQVSLKPVDDDILSDDEDDDEINIEKDTYRDFSEQKPSSIDQDELMRHIITAKENLQTEISPAEKKALHDMSVMQLINLFQDYLGTDHKLTELKIRDLIEFWQEIQLEYRNES